MDNNDENNKLIKSAILAKDNAYVPYSNFRVGAALIDEQGREFSGCNVENSSYGATCCAERTAIFKAVSEGSRKIRKMAVICDQDEYCRPCGICRQVMSEFAAEDFVLLSARPNGEYEVFSMEMLLPSSFKLDRQEE
ncbi:MAG: cytidine deaminase [Clostridiaceae bacterium]|nr:cytidine deaminase [Clostridiaceae bacterium]